MKTSYMGRLVEALVATPDEDAFKSETSSSLPEALLRQHKNLAACGSWPRPGRSAYLLDEATLVEQGYSELIIREWFAVE